MSLIKKVKNNMTADVASTFANNIWAVIRGPITLLLIPFFLSEVSQGYWYTFGSLAALSVLADLGFTTIVSQFSAHEYAHLTLNKQGILEGESVYLERIVSLFRFIFKWAISVALIAFPLIMAVGAVVLNTHGGFSEWFIPWTMYIVASGGNFIINVILSFFEGCNQIGKIQRNRLIGSIAVTLSTWVLLALNFSLYTLAISALAGVVINVLLLTFRFRKTLKQLFAHKLNQTFKWLRDFMKLIWKYALSWGAGYLIFQVYTPIAFMIYDPVQAGKVGITLALIQACFNISNVWMYIATPKLNMAASKTDWKAMDKLLYRNTLLSIATFLFGAACILSGYALLIGRLRILDRFLGLASIGILLSAYLLFIPTSSIAAYGRAHKAEPYMIPSLIIAAVSFGLTLIFVYNLSIDFIFLGIMISNMMAVILFVAVYIKRKERWHEMYKNSFLVVSDENNTAYKGGSDENHQNKT